MKSSFRHILRVSQKRELLSTMYLSKVYLQRNQVENTNHMVTREVQQATTMTRPRRAHVPPGRSRGFLINTSWTWTKGWTLTVETVTSGAMGTASNMSSWRAAWLVWSLRGGTNDKQMKMTCLQILCSVFHTSPASVRASPGAVSPLMSCGTYEQQNFLTINVVTERLAWASSSGDYTSHS